MPEADVLARMHSTKQGLAAAEAAKRLAVHGPNKLREPPPISRWRILILQFNDLMIWILVAAAIVSGLLGEVADAIAILAIVVLNAIVGYYQEFSAECSIAALKKLTAPRARVRRDGHVAVVPAADVVQGDILDFEPGDLVAADARLLRAASLMCAEAALTGESSAVSKSVALLGDADTPLADRTNMMFMGTSVTAGKGRAVVVATGMGTEIGKIAALMETPKEEKTPLQQRLEVFGRFLVWIALGIVAELFLLGLIRGIPFFEIFLTSVSLAVAAVPESLPAIVTVALALGVLRMSRRRALVRRLPAVETLGSTNVICTDKTGTLTTGEMTVRALYVAGQVFEVTGNGYAPTGEVRFEGKASDARHAAPLLELASVLIGCNDAHLVVEENVWRVIGDPTEGAMLSAGHKAGASKERLERDMPKHHEIPFDSDRKQRTVVRLLPNGRLRAFVNGAPEVLLDQCTRIYTESGVRLIREEDRTEIAGQNAAFARQALRVIGSAYRDLDPASPETLTAPEVERDLIFVGLAGMYDPPRPDAQEAVAHCQKAGIRVVMITGDQPHTAMAIAHELHIAQLGSKILSGVEIDRLDDEEFNKLVPKVAVYARVTAEHKLRIVRAWKAHGAVVAMTGDGVNDAPAIKGADIGIAMGCSGTEVTRQVADMIVTDDNFASIAAAVEQGRGIYDNIRKTLQYLLAGNCAELLLMIVCIMAGWPAPLLPIHLLWINLVTDGLPAICLATEPLDPDVMKRPPRPRHERITDRGFFPMLASAGILGAIVAFAAYAITLPLAGVEVARTYAFTSLVFSELLKALAFRSETKPLWRIPLATNLSLLLVIFMTMTIQFVGIEWPLLAGLLKTKLLPFDHCLILFATSLIPVGGVEVVKWLRRR